MAKKYKYELKGCSDILVDQDMIEHLEQTKSLPSEISFDPSSSSVRISILMEGDLLQELKTLAKEKDIPYQTLMKDMLRKQIWLNQLDFNNQEVSFLTVFEGFNPCLKLNK